jgi:hypothetical protein
MRIRILAVGSVVALAGLLGIGATPVPAPPAATNSAAPTNVHVTTTATGWTISGTAPAAPTTPGQLAQPNAAQSFNCTGTFYGAKLVGSTLEWGAQQTCSGSGWSPQKIQITLVGTCVGFGCIYWPTEDGPYSTTTFSTVATKNGALLHCANNLGHQYQTLVDLWYNGVYDTQIKSPIHTLSCTL